jgi:RNA recognition motif-containing protein
LTLEKRAREDKRNQKARDKEQRRQEKRNAPSTGGPQIVSAADIIGNVRSIDEVMHSLQGPSRVQPNTAAIPTKLLVSNLNDVTTTAGLRAHFERYGAITEAAVITDRATGVSRNFGFVTMADRKDAMAVISALHNSQLDGNSIVVNLPADKR